MREDNRKKWPEAWIDKLRELRGGGLSMEACASEINRLFPGADVSRNGCIGQCARRGIAGNKRHAARPAPIKPRAVRKAPLQRNALRLERPAALVAKNPQPSPPFDDAGPPKPATPPIGIMALASQSCRWPVDGGTEPGGLYCGSVRHPKHRSYCTYHRWLEVSPAARRRLAP